MCLPTDNKPIPADVYRTKFFLKCEKMYRSHACFKQRVKPYLDEFDFEGLDGRLDFLDSDESRAVAILLAADEVGYDDFGLLE